MYNPLLTTFRQAGLFMRTVTGTILVTFTMLVLAPTAAAAQAEYKKAKQEALLAPTEEDELSKTVVEIDEKLERVKKRLAERQNANADKEELKALRKKAEKLDEGVMEHFAEVEKHIKEKNLDPVIIQRHQDAVAQYKKDMATMLSNLRYTESARNETDYKRRLDSTEKHLKSRKHKRAQQPFDPNNLPSQSLKPTKEKPKKKKEEFTRTGLFDTPYAKYAALGDFRYDTLAGANDPAYLAESVEVKMTQAVKDKAAELNHDPVKIYHWVLNNVDWIPTWGSMQDADHTLSSKRGNAMDVASLTIALLRASGVPARYVHGTIEVPEAKFRNWTGGFESIEAAAEFAASGGIPTAGVVSGGKITKVHMEHIWVEAAIDYQPSRGAVNRSADTWVEMDPSYKQYQFLQGLDVGTIAGIEPSILADNFAASGTLNEAEGWAQGLDLAILQNAQAQAQQSLQDHIGTLNSPTVGDVIGGRKLIIKEFPVLPSGLMNKVIVKGTRNSALSNALENKITFSFGYDPYAEVFGNAQLQKTYTQAELNNRKVTLSFRPATDADQQALLSVLPSGQITDVSQLPKSIPSYLIKVVPELLVEGQVVLTGNSMTLGEDFTFGYSTNMVTHGTRNYSSIVPAGAYYALIIGGGSVSPKKLTELRARVQATQTTLQSQSVAMIGGLTREELLGDMLYAGALGYAAAYETLNQLAALQHRAADGVAPSVGVYGYKPNVNLFFGLPRSISPGGMEMDIPGLKNVTAMLNGDRTELIKFRFQIGILGSVLESTIPEQMFSTPDNPVQGVSAVKALAIAAQQGQRIYHLTPQNYASISAITHDSLTMSEIRSALAAGKEVVTHASSVSVPGWNGAGYIIVDPDTGDGAYKICGGANGGFAAFLSGIGLGAAAVAMIIALVAGASATMAFGALLILMLLVLLPIFLVVLAYNLAVFSSPSDQACMDAGMALGGTITAFIAGVHSGKMKEILLAILPAVGIAWMTKTEEIPANCMP